MSEKPPCSHKHCKDDRALIKRTLRRKNLLFGTACFSAGMFAMNSHGLIKTVFEITNSLLTEYPCGFGMGLSFAMLTTVLIGCCAWIMIFVIRSHVRGMPGVIDLAYNTGLEHAHAVHKRGENDDSYRESHDQKTH